MHYCLSIIGVYVFLLVYLGGRLLLLFCTVVQLATYTFNEMIVFRMLYFLLGFGQTNTTVVNQQLYF